MGSKLVAHVSHSPFTLISSRDSIGLCAALEGLERGSELGKRMMAEIYVIVADRGGRRPTLSAVVIFAGISKIILHAKGDY